MHTCHLLTLFLNQPVQVVLLRLQQAILILQLRDHLSTHVETFCWHIAGQYRVSALSQYAQDNSITASWCNGRQKTKNSNTEEKKTHGTLSVATSEGLCSTCCAHLPRGNAALCAHHVPVFPWFSLAPKSGKRLFSSDASVMS